MLKNKKGFTLIELIAVVTIMAIIALLATPNIISMIENGKKEQYVSDAKEFISKATYMYKLDKYKNDTNIFELSGNAHTIKLSKVQGISKMDDPYGNSYDLDSSYVQFKQESPNGVLERVVYIYLKSCNEENVCHHIGDVNNPEPNNNLTIESVKE